ncbi:MAG: hypothetical protein EBU92_10635 [Betaproteobacteria bacterium]|nr:hypothetical protein [Betaproteobacteria bacterium]
MPFKLCHNTAINRLVFIKNVPPPFPDAAAAAGSCVLAAGTGACAAAAADAADDCAAAAAAATVPGFAAAEANNVFGVVGFVSVEMDFAGSEFELAVVSAVVGSACFAAAATKFDSPGGSPPDWDPGRFSILFSIGSARRNMASNSCCTTASTRSKIRCSLAVSLRSFFTPFILSYSTNIFSNGVEGGRDTPSTTLDASFTNSWSANSPPLCICIFIFILTCSTIVNY